MERGYIGAALRRPRLGLAIATALLRRGFSVGMVASAQKAFRRDGRPYRDEVCRGGNLPPKLRQLK